MDDFKPLLAYKTIAYFIKEEKKLNPWGNFSLLSTKKNSLTKTLKLNIAMPQSLAR